MGGWGDSHSPLQGQDTARTVRVVVSPMLEERIGEVTCQTYPDLGGKFITRLMRNNFQGYSLLGHCMMLLLFILSLILIVALMYWMVRLAVAVSLSLV